MSAADLTCPTCEGEGVYLRQSFGEKYPARCPCQDGRRSPTLAEWDAMLAERDRYHELIRHLDGCVQRGGPSNYRRFLPAHLQPFASAALDAEADA